MQTGTPVTSPSIPNDAVGQTWLWCDRSFDQDEFALDFDGRCRRPTHLDIRETARETPRTQMRPQIKRKNITLLEG